ncbi:hypothetical protein BZG36_03222 [Bifiguratus adelaidae]|uniref:Uncharacterized protein n=1 Tax=Bifiguratus adelaidae TaxID=1938954 RepID=A0A261XX00_9FUNG|nr:hypothetical protein BZG36_03222 [Bifiguratus adelaidae]
MLYTAYLQDTKAPSHLLTGCDAESKLEDYLQEAVQSIVALQLRIEELESDLKEAARKYSLQSRSLNGSGPEFQAHPISLIAVAACSQEERDAFRTVEQQTACQVDLEPVIHNVPRRNCKIKANFDKVLNRKFPARRQSIESLYWMSFAGGALRPLAPENHLCTGGNKTSLEVLRHMLQIASKRLDAEVKSRDEAQIDNGYPRKGVLSEKGSAPQPDGLLEVQNLLTKIDSILQRPGTLPTVAKPPIKIRKSLKPSLTTSPNPANGAMDAFAYDKFVQPAKSTLTSSRVSEEIEPCITASSSAWKTPGFKKRLLNDILTHDFAINATLLNKTPRKCYNCGLTREWLYGIRFGRATVKTISKRAPTQRDKEGMALDIFCRNQIVAIADFSQFLNDLKDRVEAEESLSSLFQESIELRMKVARARIGGYVNAQNT